MNTTETFTAIANDPIPVTASEEFDARWAAWVARGHVHDQRIRRRFLIALPVIAVLGAAVFAVLNF